MKKIIGILIIIIVILLVSIVYVWDVKNNEIKALNSQINELDENFKLVKFVCLYNFECKEQYGEKLRQKLLSSNGIKVDEYSYSATGQNYYKYFLEQGETIDLPSNLREFIEENCPDEVYKTPGIELDRYVYKVDGSEISIIMNDNLEILCSWKYDESSDYYSKI